MKRFFITLSLFAACPGFGILHAQVTGKLKISYSSTDFKTSPTAANGVINCSVKDNVFKKDGTPVKLFFYARNDLREYPMELAYKGKPLSPKFLAPRKPTGQLTVFTVHANDVFFKEQSASGYNWKWRARPRAPLSPVSDIRTEKVKTIKCWYILQQGKKTYISDTVSIKVS